MSLIWWERIWFPTTYFKLLYDWKT